LFSLDPVLHHLPHLVFSTEDRKIQIKTSSTYNQGIGVYHFQQYFISYPGRRYLLEDKMGVTGEKKTDLPAIHRQI
jgi:hypothetical protein